MQKRIVSFSGLTASQRDLNLVQTQYIFFRKSLCGAITEIVRSDTNLLVEWATNH